MNYVSLNQCRPEETFKNKDDPFVFGILGKNPFGETLDVIRGKRIHGRRIEVRQFATPEEFEPCQILYCSKEDLECFEKESLELLEEYHVLTVGEKASFAERGGILCLTFVDDHLAFKINIAAARRARIEVSANLFELAAAVIHEDDK